MAQRGETVKFHKSKSEVQMSLVYPEYDQKGYIIKKGSIFFEIANALPNSDNMDWKNKIVMKIGLPDIGNILSNIKASNPVKLYHENESGNTSLNIQGGEKPGTYGLFFTQKKGEAITKMMIYLNSEDMNIFIPLLQSGLCKMVGW